MHQCVIAFVLRLADVLINVLKQVQNNKHINVMSLTDIVKLIYVLLFLRLFLYCRFDLVCVSSTQ